MAWIDLEAEAWRLTVLLQLEKEEGLPSNRRAKTVKRYLERAYAAGRCDGQAAGLRDAQHELNAVREELREVRAEADRWRVRFEEVNEQRLRLLSEKHARSVLSAHVVTASGTAKPIPYDRLRFEDEQLSLPFMEDD